MGSLLSPRHVRERPRDGFLGQSVKADFVKLKAQTRSVKNRLGGGFRFSAKTLAIVFPVGYIPLMAGNERHKAILFPALRIRRGKRALQSRKTGELRE